MSVLPVGFGSALGGYQIERSLRFNSADSAYLNRTFTTPTSGTTWTWSGWIKFGVVGSGSLFMAGTGASNTFMRCTFGQVSTELNWRQVTGAGAIAAEKGTSQLFRDPSAWYHIVCTWDTTNATASDRQRVYVNGVRVTAFGANTEPSLNLVSYFNTASYVHYLGALNLSGLGNYFSGYLTEVNFIDGQALTPSDFGETDSNTGVWKPKAYTGTYGTNGFYLKFADNSGTTSTTLGKDSSGNGNNWTPNNFSVTAGSGNDSLVDTPTNYGSDTGVGGEVRGNYCTLNPLDKNSNLTLSNGNLDFVPANTSDLYSGRSTFQIPSTGKWIWQVTNTNSAYMITAGLIDGATPLLAQQTVSCASMTVGSIGTFFSTTQWMNTTTSWSVTNVGNGDTLVIAYDADAGKIWFGRVASGGSTVSWYNTSGTADPSTGTDPRASGITAGKWFAGVGAYYTPSGASINYGQRPFAFTNAPSGFKALCTQNLPTPTIGATSTTQANKYFNPTIWTGNGSQVDVGFNPELLWYKARNVTGFGGVVDVLRGDTKYLQTWLTDAEGTAAGLLTKNSTGFVPGSAFSTNNYVAWNWKANGAGSSNTAGTITSTVSANTTSGFSIITYTGTGANATVGHGLGVAPDMMIVKCRSQGVGYNWAVYHKNIGATKVLLLNSTSAEVTASTVWNNTAPTTTVFSIGTDAALNGSTQTYVAYCFAPVAGYSAFGSYVGNGSTDGPFVYTGFRPRWIMFKRSDGVSAWEVVDTARSTYNVMGNVLFPNYSNAEGTTGDYANLCDALSNGFKIRSTSSASNSGTVIYAAFAESPFKYSLAR